MATDLVTSIIGAASGLVRSTTDLIVTSPGRIGRGTVREIENDLYTDNDQLFSFLAAANTRRVADFNYTSNNANQSKPISVATILTVAIVAVVIYFIIKKTK